MLIRSEFGEGVPELRNDPYCDTVAVAAMGDIPPVMVRTRRLLPTVGGSAYTNYSMRTQRLVNGVWLLFFAGVRVTFDPVLMKRSWTYGFPMK